MHIERNFEIRQAVPLYSGCKSEPLWQEAENQSEYYSYGLNTQGSIPLVGEEEVRRNIMEKHNLM